MHLNQMYLIAIENDHRILQQIYSNLIVLARPTPRSAAILERSGRIVRQQRFVIWHFNTSSSVRIRLRRGS